MLPINLPGTEALRRILRAHALRSTVSRLAGLLTDPTLQANATRIELLVHLAVVECAGREKADAAALSAWLNRILGATEAAMYEDAPEDVFVSNVESPQGNSRIFEGIWESNDFFVQHLVDIFSSQNCPEKFRELIGPVTALLKVSEEVAKRCDLERWASAKSSAKGRISLPVNAEINLRSRRLVFDPADLRSLQIRIHDLEPFVFDRDSAGQLLEQDLGSSALERRPLLRFGEDLVLVLPAAVSPAIRRFVVERAHAMGAAAELDEALARRCSALLLYDCLTEFDPSEFTHGPVSETPFSAPDFQEWTIRYDVGHFVHVFLVQGRVEEILAEGLDSIRQLDDATRRELASHLAKTAKWCASQENFIAGSTLLVIAGIGQGFLLGFEDWPENWGFASIRLSELALLVSEHDKPVSRYLKCFRYQDKIRATGVEYLNINGDFNFYCFLRGSGFRMLPVELPARRGSLISLAHDHLYPVRLRLRRLADRHATPWKHGIARVQRLSQHSYFESVHSRPVYASLGHIKYGRFGGTVERNGLVIWVVTEAEGSPIGSKIVYQLWEGILVLLDSVVEILQAEAPAAGVFEVHLDFTSVEKITRRPVAIRREIAPEIRIQGSRALVTFPPEFMELFAAPENFGEQACLKALTVAVANLTGLPDAAIERLYGLAFARAGGEGARFLHLLSGRFEIDRLLSREAKRIPLIEEVDEKFEVVRMAELGGVSDPGRIEGVERANSFLNLVVAGLWLRIKERLGRFSRADIIHMALSVNESILRDRAQWRQTSQALLALHGSENDVVEIARLRESQRSQASLASRTIIEMAVCDCPENGARVSLEEFRSLMALISVFISVATDSDAIRSGFSQPRIEVYANGEFEIDRSYSERILVPFQKAYFAEEFEGSVRDYPQLYADPEDRGQGFAPGEAFSRAFLEEYGLEPVQFAECVGECMDIAVEQDSLVPTISTSEFVRRCADNRGFTEDVATAFLRVASLTPRPTWAEPPEGFRNKDLNPWRFRRPLSATVRPIARIPDSSASEKLIFGVAALRLGALYLLERSEDGTLPGSFFKTEGMKRYIGAVVDERGHAFAKHVGARLGSAGWQTRGEVGMRELGALPAEADGDIDVLAWNESGDVLVIECKRLQLARTVAEVAETCRKFRGDAKDELGKHVRRESWVKTNPSSLERIVGFAPNPSRIESLVVTNTHVPMKFLGDLPVDPESIGPLPERLLQRATVVPSPG